MDRYFSRALPVWGVRDKESWNRFLGFHTRLILSDTRHLTMKIAARSVYRLYVNGEFTCHGPARTAKGYARVDEVRVLASGSLDIAIEVAAYDKPEKYCNDMTLEPGMLTAEIVTEEGDVLAATGYDFQMTELGFRKTKAETMSHSRCIVEWQELGEDSFAWRRGIGDFTEPVTVRETIRFLPRRSLTPDYHRIRVGRAAGVCDLVPSESSSGFVLKLAREFNPVWYDSLEEDDRFLEKVRSLKEVPFTGEYDISGVHDPTGRACVTVKSERECFAVTFEQQQTELGFVDFQVEAEEKCSVFVINTDHLDAYGNLKANTYLSRYDLLPGTYHLTTWEPKLTRYLRFVFETQGKVNLEFPYLLNDSYSDRENVYFSCSDGDLNRIYEGAKRTLRLSTLDIFMDCPQRERGGWLCDSLFSARAMYSLMGDRLVEKDFLENFMLTDADRMWKGFFPEVYPGSKKDDGDPGIINWSFWLIAELYEYAVRTGDYEFVEQVRPRVARFMEGMLSLRGESGLIETNRTIFVDWSLANRNFCTGPVNIPNNCLAVRILEEMAELYGEDAWKTAAEEMRSVIENLSCESGIFGQSGDAASYENSSWLDKYVPDSEKQLRRTDVATEGGIALELWSGFHMNDPEYLKTFVLTMGPKPLFRANPNIGKANLFIGLMIRFDVLARLGETETLLRELRDVYLEELRLGSGTFFENVNALSGCHGFNGMAGAFLVSEVLGIKKIDETHKTIFISPYPSDLRWARGSAVTGDGHVFLSWSSDSFLHRFDMRVTVPNGWKIQWVEKQKLSGWSVTLNGESLTE